ncbi:hypothetical protein NX059_005835 [Plenodomus lindquistii]|nr:hypothetical protein NX059_005835 [Plenodomus lindquistii]
MARSLHPITLTDLPDELLLNVCAQVAGLTRNTDLANLSLVSKRLRPIAQEWLLKEPRLPLGWIDKYMWELFLRSKLVRQVRTLEIWSSSHDRVKRNEDGISDKKYPRIRLTPELQERTQFIQEIYKAHIAANDLIGMEAIQEDVVPALFCNLVSNLPNLQELKLGDAWLMDFPVFERMLSPEARLVSLPQGWRNAFSASVYAKLLPQLTVLNVPADMTAMYFDMRAPTVFNFQSFKALRVLGLSMKALNTNSSRPHFADPREVLPLTLEILQISEATHATAWFLHLLCAAKIGGHFPALRRVEVYFEWHCRASRQRARVYAFPDPVDDIRSMCKKAKVELLLYFPPWALRTWSSGGTPWSLRAHAGALEDGEQKTLDAGHIPGSGVRIWRGHPGAEGEWDGDGDTVMKGSHDGIA